MTAIDPTQSTNPYANTNTTPQIDRPDQFGKDTFLKLLVAEMQYQNPLSPTDPSAMMGQTAQFSMLEALQNMSSTVQASTNANQMVMASTMVGKHVTYLDDNKQPVQGTVASVMFDTTGANPPSLHLDSGKDIPMASVTEVDK
ncbi:MAG TPA: flagellar hook capping FlgD N-terminal domain-containing protein [Acidimicrobiia bacterium]|jgi:flagellar basal-body rod modification protein FlgD